VENSSVRFVRHIDLALGSKEKLRRLHAKAWHLARAMRTVVAKISGPGARADVQAHRKTPTSSVAWRARLA
jgi:hypothetical protein